MITKSRQKRAKSGVKAKSVRRLSTTEAKAPKTRCITQESQRRIRIGELTEQDAKMLEVYGVGGAKYCESQLGIKEQRAYQRISELKKQVGKARVFLGQIESFAKRYPRIRKSFIIVEKQAWEN